jgi:acyl-CoA reductase-like NAD-dependent aldehyde dehydrogenase
VPDFTDKPIKLFQRKKYGDPLSPDTELGPMARVDLRKELHEQVQKSIAMGARLLLGS